MRVWDQHGNCVSVIKLEQSTVGRAVQFQSSGRYLGVGTTAREVLIVDWKNSLIIKRFSGHKGIVLDLKFDEIREEILYSSSLDGSVKIWDVVMGLEVGSL